MSSLNAALRSIEEAFGRVRGPEKFSPRTLDIDLLSYGDLVGVIDGYELPRDEILRYPFVLGPLAEVAGDELHPVNRSSYRQLWEAFDHAARDMKRVDLDLGG